MLGGLSFTMKIFVNLSFMLQGADNYTWCRNKMTGGQEPRDTVTLSGLRSCMASEPG